MRWKPRHPVRHCALPQAVVVSTLLHSIPDNALQGESTRRFDFQNTADTPETIDTLRLGPYLQPFSLHSPLPRVPQAPWGTRVLASGQNHAQLQRCSAFPILSLPQPPACPVFTPVLPHFHPDGTYHPFLPRFYPVLEGKLCRGKTEGKNGVNSLYPGVKPG